MLGNRSKRVHIPQLPTRRCIYPRIARLFVMYVFRVAVHTFCMFCTPAIKVFIHVNWHVQTLQSPCSACGIPVRNLTRFITTVATASFRNPLSSGFAFYYPCEKFPCIHGKHLISCYAKRRFCCIACAPGKVKNLVAESSGKGSSDVSAVNNEKELNPLKKRQEDREVIIENFRGKYRHPQP